MSQKLNPKQEYARLRKELGQLLKHGREREGLPFRPTPEEEQEVYRLEKGEYRGLWKYIELAKLYGMQVHFSTDFGDSNLNKKLRQYQAQESFDWFFQKLSGILLHQRWFHHYTVKDLSKMTGISEEKISKMELNDEDIDFSIKEVCLLLAYMDKSLIPEIQKLE